MMTTKRPQLPTISEYFNNEQSVNIDFDPAFNAFNFNAFPNQNKRTRMIYTPEQVTILEDIYSKNAYPDLVAREEAAEKCKIPENKVNIWFKNRRAKEKQEQQGNKPKQKTFNTLIQTSEFKVSPHLASGEHHQHQHQHPPSYGPSFPAPTLPTTATLSVKPKHDPPLLSQYQHLYASMNAGQGCPRAPEAASQVFSQPQPQYAIFDIRRDAEKLIVVGSNSTILNI